MQLGAKCDSLPRISLLAITSKSHKITLSVLVQFKCMYSVILLHTLDGAEQFNSRTVFTELHKLMCIRTLVQLNIHITQKVESPRNIYCISKYQISIVLSSY